jgi:hypothetical protein
MTVPDGRRRMVCVRRLGTALVSSYACASWALPSFLCLKQMPLHVGMTRLTRIRTPTQVECMLANLIHQGLVKGYIAHKQQVVVLKKDDPFRVAS